MEEWKKCRLGEICKIYGRIGFRGYTVEDLVEDADKGAISLSPTNLIGGVLDLSKPTYISWDKYYESPEIMIEEDDVVIVKTGSSVGRTAIIRNVLHPMTLNPQLVVLKDVVINKRYLGYLVKSRDFQGKLASIVVGSAIPTLSQKNLANLVIRVPSKETQERIACILSALDDKIELNNRINHNLEEQAQALFSHWLNNCEDKVAISELCDNILDYTPITAKRVVALNSSDVTEGVFAELSYTPISEIKGQFKKRFEKGDILYSEIRPRNLHYAYCYFNPMDYIASTRLMVIRSKSEKLYSSVMLYQYLQMPKVFEEFTSKTESRSGTFPQGNFKDLSSSIVPYSGDNEEISIILESLYKLIWKNIDENKSLSSLRDSLLPILMSGELKINDLTC